MVVDETDPFRRDGVMVHRFEGHEGPIYRPCTGHHCVYCADLSTAKAYLSFWRRPPERRCCRRVNRSSPARF